MSLRDLAGRTAPVLIILAVTGLTVQAETPKSLRSRYSAFRPFRTSPAEPVAPPKETESSAAAPETSAAANVAPFGHSTETWPVSTAANMATNEEILLRLEAAEAEIHTLRQQGSTPNPDNEVQPVPTTPTPPVDEPIDLELVSFLTPLDLGEEGAITFKPGYRIQTRYVYDDLNNNNDIFIRRFRLKAGGDVFGIATYGTELKFDSVGKFETEPRGVVENAWVDFILSEDAILIDNAFLRVGLYDVPFSRSALTSDSKLLFMDRSLIKSDLTEKGLADNTIGAMLHGRPCGGRFEYMVGLFDNVAFENTIPDNFENTTDLMTAGRLVVNLLDPATPPSGYADYKASYIGEGQRLAIGTNYAYQPDVDELNLIALDQFDLYAWGVDIFFNCGPWVFQAEYDIFVEDYDGGSPNLRGDGWYVQGGCYLYTCHMAAFEVAARHQQLNPEDDEDRLRWTSVGMNAYIRGHNLKVQTEYTWRDERGFDIDNDVFQVQLQFDY